MYQSFGLPHTYSLHYSSIIHNDINAFSPAMLESMLQDVIFAIMLFNILCVCQAAIQVYKLHFTVCTRSLTYVTSLCRLYIGAHLSAEVLQF